ncbi:enoyl-CoA hydratase [Camelimonas abortus]|uniref:Enoyl-CoA hydratase domain-containing protein 3, mitochondrial n=1 Tax=Camelimonas abortus TaxID=1017184 RepID=A0ABV7LFI6_9HYPH
MTAAPAREPLILRANRDGYAVLTLNAPASRNALSDAMIAALQAELDATAADAAMRALVIAANGPAFCAGHDLKEITARRADPDRGRRHFADLMARCATMMQTIVNLPVPVIAAVEGVATAAGCQLAASCDLAVAGAAARFATPGVNIGLFCSTPMVALSRNVSRKHAMEMLLTGEMIDAGRAERMGLVNRVVPAGEALAEACALAERIASKSRLTLRTGKRAFYAQLEMGLADAYAYAAQVMVENMLARDAEEGIGAFVEKRQPVWRDA